MINEQQNDCLEWMKKANEWKTDRKHANSYRWLLTFDEINVSVGDDSCEQKWMNNG